jgi:hypothetical protein
MLLPFASPKFESRQCASSQALHSQDNTQQRCLPTSLIMVLRMSVRSEILDNAVSAHQQKELSLFGVDDCLK